MIALLLVVLTFVLLGLGTVALAMRSGPKAPKRGARPSRGSQRLAFVGTSVVALAFGIGVPALVLAYNNDSESKAAPGGLQLSAAQQGGALATPAPTAEPTESPSGGGGAKPGKK